MQGPQGPDGGCRRNPQSCLQRRCCQPACLGERTPLQLLISRMENSRACLPLQPLSFVRRRRRAFAGAPVQQRHRPGVRSSGRRAVALEVSATAEALRPFQQVPVAGEAPAPAEEGPAVNWRDTWWPCAFVK